MPFLPPLFILVLPKVTKQGLTELYSVSRPAVPRATLASCPTFDSCLNTHQAR